MKYKIILLVSMVLVGGMVYAMPDEQRPSRVVNQRMGDADRSADGVHEWLLEGVEVIEMEQLIQLRIEKLFLADWHRKILKEYRPEMVSDALAQLEHLADFQALANSQLDSEQGSLADSQDGDNGQVEGVSRPQELGGAGASRAQIERRCLIALLSALAHALKTEAVDKYEQMSEAGCVVMRYLCWVGGLGISSALIGACWPEIRCGP